MAEIEVSYPKRCRDCHAFYLTSYRCHNEYGDEAHCTLGYMSGYDMRDFSGDVRFKHCKLSSSPSPNKDSDDIGMDFCGELCKYTEDLIKQKNAEILELQGNLKFVRGTVTRLLETIDKQQAEIARLKEAYAVYEETTGLKQVRADTAKKFAEWLKVRKYKSSEWSHGEHPYVVEESDIDEVLEEMTEETP